MSGRCYRTQIFVAIKRIQYKNWNRPTNLNGGWCLVVLSAFENPVVDVLKFGFGNGRWHNSLRGFVHITFKRFAWNDRFHRNGIAGESGVPKKRNAVGVMATQTFWKQDVCRECCVSGFCHRWRIIDHRGRRRWCRRWDWGYRGWCGWRCGRLIVPRQAKLLPHS